MVDRHARDIAAGVLRDFVTGSTTNDEYERRYPTSRNDPALWEIYVQVWFSYSDLKTHTLTGKYALSDTRRAFVERCILFMESDFDFRWPCQRFRPWYGVLRLLGFRATLRRREEEEMSVGDIEVWPFLRKAEYEGAFSKQQQPKHA